MTVAAAIALCQRCGRGGEIAYDDGGGRWLCRGCSDPALPSQLAESTTQEDPAGLRVCGIDWSRVRPLKWLWEKRIPMGLPSLIVGEEGIGKGTLAAWLIARTTRGELAGDFHGKPMRVLVVGDEDGFEPIWVPRLHAAGADLDMLYRLADGEHIDDMRARADDLRATIEHEQIGLVLLDQVLDHVNGGTAGEGVYNPKNVREALMPLRRAAGETGVAAVGLLHPVKGNVSSFRQMVGASHQFNAVSRSSLWLARDPEDSDRRVLVRGKGNHSGAPRSFEFAIAPERFELVGHGFEVPMVVGAAEGNRTVDDLLSADKSDKPVRSELEQQLEPLLTDEFQTRAALARAVGRDAKDGSVGNALRALADRGVAVQDQKGWKRSPSDGVQCNLLTSVAPHPPEHGEAELGAAGTPNMGSEGTGA